MSELQNLTYIIVCTYLFLQVEGEGEVVEEHHLGHLERIASL